jgi:hypothetical protein
MPGPAPARSGSRAPLPRGPAIRPRRAIASARDQSAGRLRQGPNGFRLGSACHRGGSDRHEGGASSGRDGARWRSERREGARQCVVDSSETRDRSKGRFGAVAEESLTIGVRSRREGVRRAGCERACGRSGACRPMVLRAACFSFWEVSTSAVYLGQTAERQLFGESKHDHYLRRCNSLTERGLRA